MAQRVLVVGAGPTGLALAIHLALHDVPVRVVDAAQAPATTSRALGLQSRGIEVLERIGALGDLPQRSRSLLTMYYNDGPRTRLRLQVGRAAASLPKHALLISQAEVEATLRGRLGELGGKVEWSTRLVSARQDDAGVVATLTTTDGVEREQRVEWLVGCDGAHSAVRREARIGFPGTKVIDRLLMIDVRADWPYDPDGSITWMDSSRMLSVTALPDNIWRVFSEPGPEVGDDLSESEITDRVLAEFSRRSGISTETVQDVCWATQFRIHRRLADTFRRGRILIAGDAAHIQSPTGGQGQNTGLGDAENLGWKLGLVATGRADPKLLDSYDAERRPLAAKVLKATTGAVSIMLPDRPWKRLLRDRVVMPALRIPAVQRRLWRLASQLDISYRSGPIADQKPWSRSPRPGDRMPDVACRREDGSAVNVQAALGGRWAVVADDQTTANRHRETLAHWVGPEQVLTLVPERATTSDVLIIRPDGHVGWRGRPAPERLAAWLRQTLGPV